MIDTSAVYGESYIVQVVYNTDPAGNKEPRETRGLGDNYTLHGSFDTFEEARAWGEAYPDDPDVSSMDILVMNRVRPMEEE